MGQHGRICNSAITNHKSEIIKDFGGLIGGHLSTRHREVNRLLPTQTGGQPRQSAFFLELRAHRGGCAAGTRGELVDFLVDVFGRDGQILATGPAPVLPVAPSGARSLPEAPPTAGAPVVEHGAGQIRLARLRLVVG